MATNITLGTLFTADVSNFIRGVSQIRTALNSLHQSMTQVGSGASAMGKGIAAGVNATTQAIKKQNAAVKASQQSLTGLAGMWQRVQQAMKTSLAYGTAGAAIYGIIDGLKQGVTAIAEYDQALKNLQAITQASDSEMVGLADTIKEVSSKYIYSTKEIADGAVLMGQAGFTASQTMQALDAATKLSMGTLEDMALTVDLLTTTIVSFQMKSVESSRVADVMANAMNRSKLTLDKLRVSFNYVASAAYEAGISLEETAAAMSVMSNAGMRASTIGTSLRQLLATLIAPNRRVREEFQGMGIQLSDLDPKLVGFSTVIQNLSKVLIDQKTGLVDMGKAYTLFGLRAAQAAAILARSADDDYPRMLAMMYEVGSASEMAGKQMEGLVAKFKNIIANAQLVAIALGEGGLVKVFNMIADALLNLTKAVKAFVESGFGQIAIQVVALSAVTAAFIFIMGKLIALITSGGAVFTFFSLQLVKIATLIKDIQVAGLVGSFGVLFRSLISGHPALIAISLAIGAIATAVSYFNDSTNRQIETLQRSSNAYKTAIDTLDSYADVLLKLRQKQEKGQNIDIEYESTIKRLIQAYPELSGVIDNNVASLEANRQKLLEISRAASTKYIDDQIRQLKILDTQLRNMGFDEFASDADEAFMDANPFAFSFAISGMSKNMKAAGTDAESLAESMGQVRRADQAVGEEATKVNVKLREREQLLTNVAMRMKDEGKSLDEITAKLRELNVSDKEMKNVIGAIKSFKDDISKEAQEIEKAMKNLPHMFTALFEGMDAASKVSFAKAAKAMESEISQYEKTAHSILKTETDRYEAIAFIRTKHLMKFADDVMKEKMTSEQLLTFKRNLLEKERELARSFYEDQMVRETNRYKEQLKVAGDNAVKIENIRKDHAARIIEIRKSLAATEVAITLAGQAEIVEAYKKAADEVVKAGEKMANDYLNELESMVKEGKSKIDRLKKAQVKSQESIEEKIRNLKQKGMTDVQKFADDEKRIQELLNKAREAGYEKSYDIAKEYYDGVVDLANGLARDVKDSQGKTLKSEKDTTETALKYLNQVKSETSDLYDKQIQEEENKLRTAKGLMSDINDLMLAFGVEWDKLNQTKLKNFISSLDAIIGRTENLTEKTSNLRKDWEALTKKLSEMPKPQEPTAGAKPSVSAVEKPKTGEGAVTVEGKTVNVKDLAGGEKSTISVGGKTYDVEDYAKKGEGTISVDGKTLDVKQLAEYEGKVIELTNKVQEAVTKSHEMIGESTENTVESLSEVGTTSSEELTKISESSNTATLTAQEKMSAVLQQASATIEQIEMHAERVALVFQGWAETISSSVSEEFVKLKDIIENQLKISLSEIYSLLDKITKKPLSEIINESTVELMDKFKKLLKEAKNILLELKEAKKDEGAGEKEGENGEEGGGDTNSAPGNVEWRKGGMIEAIRRRLGGAVDSVQRFSRGMKLPGYGGGDKVKALLEPGEFVINKESTSKFQPVLEAINSNSVSVADFGKRFGGIIQAMKPQPLAFATGGNVPSYSEHRTIQPLTIKIKPRYMSGDRATAKRFAVEIQRELNELEKRMGRR